MLPLAALTTGASRGFKSITPSAVTAVPSPQAALFGVTVTSEIAVPSVTNVNVAVD